MLRNACVGSFHSKDILVHRTQKILYGDGSSGNNVTDSSK